MNPSYSISQAIEAGLVHYRAGRLADAEAVYRQILSAQPENAFAWHMLGTIASQAGQYSTAIEWIGRSVALDQTNASAYNNLGWAYRVTKRFDEAISCFQKALALCPDFAQAHNNLGCVFTDQKKSSLAIASYQKALELEPAYADACGNTGYELYHQAHFPEAIDYFKKALVINPNHRTSLIGALEAQSRITPIENWASFCDEALLLPGLCNPHRFIALTFSGIGAWATGEDIRLDKTLSEIKTLYPVEIEGALENFANFHHFIAALSLYKKEHSSLYSGSNNKIFLAGDSHCLSYSGMNISINDVQYKISPYLIFGAKAWHMSGDKNMFNANLDILINSLPQGATLMLSFGEIDCREDEGIILYWKKTGGGLAEIISAQAAKYVLAMTKRAARKNIKLIFLAVPAPLSPTEDRRKLIALFNEELQKNVLKAGFRYLDVYMPDSRLHIDNYHLKPETLALALAR